MQVLSQGSSHPEPGTTVHKNSAFGASHTGAAAKTAVHRTTEDTDDWATAVRAATENVARIESLNAESGQRGNSWALPVTTGRRARTPIWTGRTQWQHQVRTLLNSPTGTELCKKNTISTEAAFAVAVIHASLAEGKTGRGVTASRERIANRAGVSITVVKRARRVLSALGMAVEQERGRYLTTLESMAAEAHHGHRQFRAASVWALISPRAAVTTITTPPFKKSRKPSRATLRSAAYRARTTSRTSPQSGGRGPLSPSGGFVLQSLVVKFSPTHAQARAGKPKNPQKSTPRPIELQRTAAQLIAHIPALKTTKHVGQICDILARAGIDVTRWTGRDIARELTTDTQTRGWVWPTQLTQPTAFLRWRLAQIDWSAPSPAERACENDQARLAEQAARRREARDRDSHVAHAHTRADIMKQLREQLSARTPA
ncbi:replication protein (plasmid) [Rhodococcus globerulus]|uniref:replication protein n=1 Tax=Rhodococcus globerulus TaxID=33008 RepID=UPI0039EAF02C